MIINELNYQEIATEANELEGGIDFSLNYSQFNQQASVLQTGTASTPGGTLTVANGGSLKINTAGFGGVVLGL